MFGLPREQGDDVVPGKVLRLSNLILAAIELSSRHDLYRSLRVMTNKKNASIKLSWLVSVNLF